MKRITRRNLLQGLAVAPLSAALDTSFELQADDYRKSAPTARKGLGSISTEQFGASRLRRTIQLDDEEWRLQPFAFGQGVREGVPHGATASESRPVSIPNDVQLTSFVGDPLGQSAEIVDVNKKEWWYTRSFKSPKLEASQQATLVFDGVDYFADIWLNGEKLGSHEGAYTRFSFDVTTRLSTKGENHLAVRVTAPWTVPGRSHYEFMKGEFDEYWDALPGPGMVVYPLGLHRGVRIEITSRTRIDAIQVSTTEIGEHRAELNVLVELNNRSDAIEGDIHLTIVPDNFSGKPITVASRPFSLQGGLFDKQRIEWSISIPDARLWWTWDTGPQDLYRAEASLAARDGSVLDHMTATFGIRTFERDENLLYRINGRPIFFRGAWYPMSKLYPASTDSWTYEKDLRLARNCNMNHLVNYTVIEKESFYDLADRLGIALFVELPFNQEGPIDALNAADPRRPAFLQWASSEVGQIVRSLSNHPSIAVWSPVSEVTENGRDVKVSWDPRVEQAADGYALFLKTMQDVVKENDPDSLYFRSYCDFGEHHFWEGTFVFGSTYDQQFNASAKFISEYGAQALFPYEDATRVADLEKYWQPGNGRFSPVQLPIQVKPFSYVQPFQYFGLDFFTANLGVNVSRHIRSLREYINDSGLYQAFIYGYAADAYRRKLFAPVNGIRSWMFKSFPEIPVGGFGVIDAFDKANRAYYEQKRTFASVNMSFARRYALESILAGSLLRVPVWISNAEPVTLSEVTVEFSLYDLQGQSLKSQTVTTSSKANHAEAVANVEWAAPQQAGIYVLRGWVRQSGKQLASAQTYVKVVSAVTQKRVLVIGSAEWAQPVCEYLGGLGAQVTLTLAEYSIVHPMHFPASAAELKKNFDVIWLTGYDKYWREAPEQLATTIAEAVRSGVTFVHTGSPASFHGGGENTAALDLTPLRPVLPVELSHENDVLWQPSFRVGSELNPLRSHEVRQVTVTEHAPEWLRSIPTSELAPASFHMLPARNDANVLMKIDGQPLIVRGNFGTGQTFAYLGFTPEGSKEAAGNPLILDRVIRASGGGRQFAIMSAILLALASGATPSVAIADLIESRAKPMFESLIELPAGSAPRATASWSRRQDGRLSGHVRIENGDSYALDLRVRLTGSDIQSGRVLQLWSNQYFDLFPHEVTECDVTIYVQGGGEPGQIALLWEDFRGSRWEQPVEY